MRNRIEKQGRAELVPLLIPDYPPGCKRLIVSENYLEALCQENIVVERSPIKQIKGRTILTEDGKENEFDILCLATGFDVQGFLGQLQGMFFITSYRNMQIYNVYTWWRSSALGYLYSPVLHVNMHSSLILSSRWQKRSITQWTLARQIPRDLQVGAYQWLPQPVHDPRT